MKRSITFIIAVLLLNTLHSQNDPISDAMKREIQRGIDSLRIEKMLPPSFISYSISDARTLQIKSTLGSLILSEEQPFRTFSNRILVGENGKTNENYLDENTLWYWNRNSNEVPLTGGSDDIRRSLWLATDNNFKNAVTNYEAKISALSQQSFSDEEKNIHDFSPSPKNESLVPYQSYEINKLKLEKLSRALSSVFKKYPVIQKSEVNIFAFDGQVYFADSEGSSARYPVQIASVKVTAETQAPGGEILNDHVIWFAKNTNQLPDEKALVAEIEKTAKNLTDLTQKNPVTEPYSGPVLFEGQAAAEAFVQMFFSQTDGLVSVRKPILGNEHIINMAPDRVKENSVEAMINKKIISRDITIEALPFLSEFEKSPLTGSFITDAEGVNPPEKLLLVENGVLKNLLADRTPSQKMNSSNGHSRPALSNGGIKAVTGPGVIKMTNNNPVTSLDSKQLRQKLFEIAIEEDLEYAYIVRKVISEAADIQNLSSSRGDRNPQKDISKTIRVYRVNISDESEELVSLAEVQGLSVKSFKRLLATSSEMQVYNTMLQPVGERIYSWLYNLSGIPASFILPHALLFEELDVVREKQGMVKNIPLVPNPLASKKK
ncbi:MAG: hypothetical protein KKD38_00510 [Candidatus Delongbacteria bacterium]|nr:hypothetical protein [Candidatus Delongbacteria bacterium]MCG2761090.1 metallopeptidase TldD-related protein [Candidatus Delongbacteria bacterium]